MTTSIPCKTCDSGLMNPAKIHRMSGPVVAIGYLLLIPSILAILISGGCALLSLGAGASVASSGLPAQTVKRLQEEGVPPHIIEKLEKSEPLTEEDRQSLTPSQLGSVTGTQLGVGGARAAGAVGGALGAAFFAFTGIGAFVSGLLGWLLVMKKKVLKCAGCGAVVDAS